MPFCENCGNKISDTTKFCAGCGEKVNSVFPLSEIEDKEVKSKWSLEKFLEENPPNYKGIITCPRCLGKGEVDADDIKRLSMEDNWIPGDCLYCDGVGLINIKKTTTAEVNQEYFDNLTDIQLTNLETSVGLMNNNQEAYSYYDDYNFDRYFGHLTKDYNLYLKNNIPESKLNLFILGCSKNSTAYWEFYKPFDWSYFTPYVYFEVPDSNNGEDGILLSVYDKKRDLNGSGEVMLIINQGKFLFSHFIGNIMEDDIKQDGSKIKITEREFDLFDEKDTLEEEIIQFSFEKSTPFLSELVRFIHDNKTYYEENEEPNEIEYDYEKYFGHLRNLQKVHIGEDIPKRLVQSFINKIKDFFNDKDENQLIDDSSYHVYFDGSNQMFGNGDSGLLLLTQEYECFLYIINPSSAGIWKIPLLYFKDFKLIESQLIIPNNPDIIVDFPNCNSLFESLIKFQQEYKVENEMSEEECGNDDSEEEDDESPIKPKDGAGIR